VCSQNIFRTPKGQSKDRTDGRGTPRAGIRGPANGLTHEEHEDKSKIHEFANTAYSALVFFVFFVFFVV